MARPLNAFGQKRTSHSILVMSALPPKADIGIEPCNVRFVPKADIGNEWATPPKAGTHAFS